MTLVPTVAYVTDSAPWESTAETDVMDDLFGEGNWASESFTDFNLGDFNTIWLSGSDGNASFPAWMEAHRSELEDWVEAGGHLFVNAAPNYGPVSVDLGFNLTLNNGYDPSTYSNHVVLIGPAATFAQANGASTEYYGGSFGHAVIIDTVNPAEITPLIVGDTLNDDGDTISTGDVLVFERYGAGTVVAGGITIPMFWATDPSFEDLGGDEPYQLHYGIVGFALGLLPTVIDSNGAGDTAVAFLSENRTHITDVHASGFGDASYAISGGADAALFQIDAVTGELSFIAAPDFETPAGAEGNVYDVVVSANIAGETDTQAIAVKVTNVNEGNAIDSNGGGATASVSIDENTSAVTTVHATDIDAGTRIAYSITGGADAGLFHIDAATGDLTFVSAPKFEAPADAGSDNVYDVTVQASDGSLTSSQAIAVTVNAVNESPMIDSNWGGETAAVSVDENTSAVTTVHATDPDAGATLTYAITGGADAAQFEIDAATGALSFVDAPNFEAPTDAGGDNVYDVTVQASDGSLTSSQAIAVTVNAVNESPMIDSNDGGATASVSVDENTSAVTTVHATDADADTTLTYAITGGADAAQFEIDAATGALSFIAAPNFEAPADAGGDNVYDVTVQASDGSLTSSQDIAVTVNAVNEGPMIDSNWGGETAEVALDENSYAVTTVHATDPDAGTTLTYAITGGADAAQFEIDAATGALSFVAAPNFEAPTDAGGDNVYDVTVQASDGSLTSSQAIAVTVGDVTNETLFGTPNSDALTTEDGNDTIRALASDDTLVSGAGNDVLDGGLGADHMTGGTGDDTYVLDNAGDVVVENAGEGKDTIRTSISIAALTVNVEKLWLTGTDNIDGHGNATDNIVKGNSGNNMLFGHAGNDLLVGGAGNDVLNGGTGADRMKGGTGNDVYIVASFNDRVIENAGEGTDTIRSYISISALADNVENLSLYGRADLDGGRAGIDGVGNGLDNQIRGNNGDNQLYGLGGMDRLFGGLGNDILSGGAGRDVLVGGAGQDTFLFDTALDSHANVDCLKDFAGSGVDNIQLGRSVFTAFTHTGSLTADEFYAAAGAHSAHDASDRIIYDTTTGNLFYDADGIGGADEVQFATLGVKTHPQLLFSDIAIYA